jgi:anti-sigma B factor antagonist
MTITRTLTGETLTIALTGRLDTLTSPDLAKEIASLGSSGAKRLVFDVRGLGYISSAGLGVLVKAQRRMTEAGGVMAVTGASGIVRQVMDLTGLTKILDVR